MHRRLLTGLGQKYDIDKHLLNVFIDRNTPVNIIYLSNVMQKYFKMSGRSLWISLMQHVLMCEFCYSSNHGTGISGEWHIT